MNRVRLSTGFGFLLACLASGCPDPQAAPCSAADTVMAAHALECAARVRAECADVPDDECPAIKECDEWGEKRCGLGAGGSAGAK